MFNRFLKQSSAHETDVATTARALENRTAQIVDVREQDEWAEGHIADAIHIPLGELPTRQKELDPQRPLITVCRSGKRSLVAAEQLLGGDFRDVKSLAGGMKAWVKSDQPIER